MRRAGQRLDVVEGVLQIPQALARDQQVDVVVAVPRARPARAHDLVVAPESDGKGIGSALLAFAERWAKEHRCRYLTLGVFPANERARALYERHGYGVETLRMAKSVK